MIHGHKVNPDWLGSGYLFQNAVYVFNTRLLAATMLTSTCYEIQKFSID